MIMTQAQCRGTAQIVLLSLVFSMMMLTMPSKAEAGLLGSVFSGAKKATRFLVVNGGALVAGYFGGVLGAALGGGPIGMVAGGIGGFLAARKALTWATETSTRVATIVGAAAGGLLVAGMGMPMLAIGVIGGGLLGWSLSKLIGKLTGNAVKKAEMAAQDTKVNDYLSTVPAVAAPVEVKQAVAKPSAAAEEKVENVSQAYDRYLAAYKAYMAASEKGDTAAAQTSYAEYKKYLTLYNSLMKQ